MVRVGIPRALFYYYYYPLWKEFFNEAGAEVVLSPPTNKKILEDGLRTSLSEACLPVKLFFGHVLSLAEEGVDYIFVPRVISVEPKAYICPKFMGLPDMLKARLSNLPPLLEDQVDARRQARSGRVWSNFLIETAAELHLDRREAARAIDAAITAEETFHQRLLAGLLPEEAMNEGFDEVAVTAAGEAPLKIGLLGHPYLLYDPYVSMNLVARLRRSGATVITPESVPESEIEERVSHLPKRLFWTLGKRLIGAALSFDQSRELDGVIYLSSFGCGPESMIGELIERWAKRSGRTPFMKLTIDEHSGEAGLVTRLEAFTEMIKWRRRSETHLSTHG